MESEVPRVKREGLGGICHSLYLQLQQQDSSARRQVCWWHHQVSELEGNQLQQGCNGNIAARLVFAQDRLSAALLCQPARKAGCIQAR